LIGIYRRELLIGGSAAALAVAMPLEARAPRGALVGSTFNGGRSQGQSNAPYQGDFPFINLIKQAAAPWGFSNDATYNVVPPNMLDPNNMPAAGVPTRGNIVYVNINLSPKYGQLGNASNPLVVTWEGNAKLDIGNTPISFVSGSKDPVLNGYGYSDGKYHGRYVWYPTSYNSDGSYSFNIGFERITTYADKFSCVFSEDERAFLAGQYFSTKYLSTLRGAKFGLWRFMDWLATNGGGASTWESRKKINHFSWQSSDMRKEWWGGLTTNSGTDYSLTVDEGYVWNGPNGNYSTGSAPVHNQTMHVRFNVNAARAYEEPVLTAVSPITFTKTSTIMSNGDIVGITVNSLPELQPGINYYVVNKTANTFQIALTSGGTALNSSSSGSIGVTYGATKLPTLNINGTGRVPIKQDNSYPITFDPAVQGIAFSKAVIATLIYDGNLKSWLMYGGNNNHSEGLINHVPPEVCFDLCRQLGMHPHWTTPLYAMDPMTDWVTELANYNKNNNPGWMIPHYEAVNEVWNSFAQAGKFSNSMAGLLWPSTTNAFNGPNWAGKINSTLGQAVAAVHGLGNLGTTYEVMIGVQTDGFGSISPSYVAPFLTADEYVSQSAPSQSGYTKSAASGWASVMSPATYIAPSLYRTYREPQLAWDWVYTHAGNVGLQAADLNTYVDSLRYGIIGGPSLFTGGTAGVINWPSHGLAKGTKLNINNVGTDNVFPAGLGGQCYVGTIVDADHFNVSNSQGGADIAFSGSATGTFYLSAGSFNLVYEKARYGNVKLLGERHGVNKMHAYEGGFSPDASLGGSWFSPISAATKASSCKLTLPQTFSPDGFPSIWPGAVTGSVIAPQSVGGMTQLNCLSSDDLGSAMLTAGSASISWSSNKLIAGQIVMFRRATKIPPNFSVNTPYYVIPPGLSSNAFQLSATKGGSSIVAGGRGSYNAAIDTGWRVTGVSGNDITIDVESTEFDTYAGGGAVVYMQMFDIVNQFRSASYTSPNLYQITLENYANFTGAGGGYPSQYTMAGPSVSAWRIFWPDMWANQSTVYAAIIAYNAS
jgi:hypothetical protein